MTILVKKDSISSKINTVYYVVPASVRAIFIQDFAKGEISYKVKNRIPAHPIAISIYKRRDVPPFIVC